MATCTNLDDIELTDFDNNGIFVIHPKPRRNSSESCHTFDTNLGESTPSIGTQSVSDNHITDIVEVESDSDPPSYDEQGMSHLEDQNSQTDPSSHVIIDIGEDEQEPQTNGDAIMDANESDHDSELPTNEPEIIDTEDKYDENSGNSWASNQITLISRSVLNFWNKTKAYFYIDLKKSFNWTILQTWYNIAFIQCVVPFYIRQNGESERYERYSFRPQQYLCVIGTFIVVMHESMKDSKEYYLDPDSSGLPGFMNATST
ncbi:unnamed protein product [Orchesella dallaii]|uniref:PiggyBac transposable element-derived protein domain-containing protein n=1 Tax=Orchesella dallaii TaxID=48710 RepID=A0ABP1R0B0_9HEXA